MSRLHAALACLALLACQRTPAPQAALPPTTSRAASAACTDEARKAPHCGGIAALRCDGGLTCVDDPCDDCDPEHGGADCGGICVRK